MNTFERIYEVVKRIPRGKVATYGMVATMAGNPRWSQIVGYALHVNPDTSSIPCHRVVNRFGNTAKAFAFGGEDMQRKLLEAEGVRFTSENTVDLKLCLWNGEYNKPLKE